MKRWEFSGGTVLEEGGVVHGHDAVAKELRRRLNSKAPVQVLPIPMRASPLEPKYPLLLHYLAVEVEHRCKRAMSTEYEPDDDDAPPELAKKLADRRINQQYEEFGRIH